jgi:hypothetical protein
MPDPNKFAKLREIGYTIKPCCDLCQHRSFPGFGHFGSCQLHRYEHARQSNPEDGRGVSIVRWGCCPSFEAEDLSVYALGAHSEFLEKT